MKAKKIVLTTLAAMLAAAAIPAQVAFAEGESNPPPQYPSSFIQVLDMGEDGLTDYAICGDTYAFAVKTSIFILSTDESGDRKLESKDIGTQITHVDYAEGKLYYEITSGSAYRYPDVSTPTEHEFPAAENNIQTDYGLYILNSKTELKLLDKGSSDEILIGEGFSKLKLYDGVAYTVKNDCPYYLEGEAAQPLDLSYTDFSAADDISTGTVASALKRSDYTVETATLKAGSYYTRIDENDIGKTFRQIRTYKADGAKSCLVLASDGNLSLIVTDGGCFITATESLKPIAYAPPANDWAQGANGQRKAYLRERTGIYSSPFMCKSTLITTALPQKAIAVDVLEKFSLDFIDAQAVFYRISYTEENGAQVSGFVAAGFLDEYDYSAEDRTPTLDGIDDFSYASNVTTVILVLVVVGLVIIAIVYLTIVGTKPNKPAKREEGEADGEEGNK